MEHDSYKTIVAPSQAVTKDKGSRFITYAYPIEQEPDVKPLLDALRKKHYDATHHCYAWRLGAQGELSRANDDGEPSSTAGKPILGQLLSNELTNILIVVVRYFGGTKLGVPGLIGAYKEAAAEVIETCEIIEKSVDALYEIEFSYFAMNDVMKVIKEVQPTVLQQAFDNLCAMSLAIRQGREEVLRARLEKCEGVTLNFIGYR